MSEYGELLGVTKKGTLEFFWLELREVADTSIEDNQILYIASVLAHFAQVSTFSASEMPAPSSLVDLFDNFVMNGELQKDPDMLETAGTYSLLLAGFFRSQMRRRHNIKWYAKLGSGFFRRSGLLFEGRSPKRSRFLQEVGRNFIPLSDTCYMVGEKLIRNNENPYLIKVRRES